MADRRTLRRRLAADLTGLPATPTEIRAFLDDQREDAVAEAERQAVLASPIVQAAMEAFPDAELIDWPNKRNSA
jgi:hypothetical protein